MGDFADRIGGLTDRDILVVGAALYWCEGAKAKPWRRWVPVTFVNSDPGLVKLFLAFLRSMGVDDGRVNYRVYIHESADASSAVRWWAQQLAVSAEIFQRTTVKKHRPTTNRRNVGTDYHGCLSVTVRRGRELYWRIEGIMRGLTASGRHAPAGSP